MPNTPFAHLLVSIDGGALQDGDVECAASAEIQFSYESTQGWPTRKPPYMEIAEYPEGWTPVPSTGWVLTAVAQLAGPAAQCWRYYGMMPPPAIAAPGVAHWGPLLPRLVVGGGLLDGVVSAAMRDERTVITVRSANNLKSVGYLEASQRGDWREWTGPLQADLRTIDALLTSLAAGTGGAPEDAPYVLATGTADPDLSAAILLQALAATLRLQGASTIEPLTVAYLAAAGSFGAALVLERALASGSVSTTTGTEIAWQIRGATTATQHRIAALRPVLTAISGDTLTADLQVRLASAGTIGTKCTIHADGSVTVAGKIMGVVAGTATGHAVEYDQLASAIAAAGSGYVSAGATLTAGTGCTGGGLLSSSPTINVATADGSIQINTDNIEATGAFGSKAIATTGTLGSATHTITKLALGTTPTAGLRLRDTTTGSGRQFPPSLWFDGVGDDGTTQVNVAWSAESPSGSNRGIMQLYTGTGAGHPSSILATFDPSDQNFGGTSIECGSFVLSGSGGLRGPSGNRGGYTFDGSNNMLLKSYGGGDIDCALYSDSGSTLVAAKTFSSSGYAISVRTDAPRFVSGPDTPSIVAHAATFDLSKGNQDFDVTDSVTITITGAVGGQRGYMIFNQDGSGHTVTMPTNGTGVEYTDGILALGAVTTYVDPGANKRTILEYIGKGSRAIITGRYVESVIP